MVTKNLSGCDNSKLPSAENMKFGIVVAEWNYQVTGMLEKGALQTLVKHGAKKNNIVVKHVPGSFELTLGGQFFAKYTNVDAIIILGCVIQGETPHFEYICQSVAEGTTKLNMKYNIPFVFGVLTTLTEQQALDRAGGRLGNKGDEAAVTAIKMVALHRQMIEGYLEK